MTLPVDVVPGPADHSTARKPVVSKSCVTGGFCVTPFGEGAIPKIVEVALTDGGAPGPTCETRSRFVPSQCRGMSVPASRFENARYSTFSNVTLLAKLPGLTEVDMEFSVQGVAVTFSSHN